MENQTVQIWLPIIVVVALPAIATIFAFAFREAFIAYVSTQFLKAVYVRMDADKQELRTLLSTQYRNVKRDLTDLRQNGHAFADRVNRIDDRINQGSEELENLRERLRGALTKDETILP